MAITPTTPPRSPAQKGGLKTPRDIALDMGTDRAGFTPGIPYDTVAGCPVADAGGSDYKDNTPDAVESPVITRKPFKVG